jgi:hypothetical protein
MKITARQLLLGVALGMLGAGASQGAIINFAGIEMQTSGSASFDAVPDDLILTPASNGQAGAVFSTSRFVLAPNDDFTTEFSFNIDRNGADGLAFVMQRAGPSALGASGNSLGLGGIAPSFSIALDTYDNAFGQGDNLNMVRSYTDGNIGANNSIDDLAGLRQNLGFALDDNVEHFARIEYTGTTDMLNVFVSPTSSFGVTPTLSVNVDLNALLFGEAHFGFTGATGGLNAEHRITDWTAPTLTQVIPPPPTLSGIAISANGDASSVSDNLLRLTEAQPGQAGSAFALAPVALDNDHSFASDFTFRLSGSQAGADGIAFVIQNDLDGFTAVGGSGNGLGYEGIAPSLAIAFDTYDPTFGQGPNINILRILENGVTGSSDALALVDLAGLRQNVGFELNNGAEYFARIVYDGLNDLLQVFLTDDLSAGFGTAFLERTIDLQALLGPSAFVGFSGGTGGLSNLQEVLAWTLATDASNVPEPMTSLLLLLALFAMVVHRKALLRA